MNIDIVVLIKAKQKGTDQQIYRVEYQNMKEKIRRRIPYIYV